MQSINILVAFGAGLATFFAPCTFAALPSFLSYLALSISGGEGKDKNSKFKTSIVYGTVAYLAGFLLVFTILGLAATQIGIFLRLNKEIFQVIGGLLIAIFGLFMLVGEYIPPFRPFFNEKKLSAHAAQNKYFPFVLGLTNAFAWTPCIGPILGFILLLASSTNNFYAGGAMLFAYGLGTTLPFIFLAIFFDRIRNHLYKLNRFSLYIYKISAATILILGIAYATGWDQTLFGILYRMFVNLGYSPM